MYVRSWMRNRWPNAARLAWASAPSKFVRGYLLPRPPGGQLRWSGSWPAVLEALPEAPMASTTIRQVVTSLGIGQKPQPSPKAGLDDALAAAAVAFEPGVSAADDEL